MAIKERVKQTLETLLPGDLCFVDTSKLWGGPTFFSHYTDSMLIVLNPSGSETKYNLGSVTRIYKYGL